MKKFISIILALGVVLSSFNVVFAEDELINVALGKKVKVSGCFDLGGLPPKNLVDGNDGSYWASPSSGVGWAVVDLGLPHIIEKIELSTRTDLSDASCQDFKIEASNEKDFANAFLVDKHSAVVPSSSKYTVEVKDKTPYRYVRYYRGQFTTLAELRVFVKAGNIPKEEKKPDFGELSGVKNIDVLETLYWLNVINDPENIDIKKVVTKGEYAKFVCDGYKIQENNLENKKYFADLKGCKNAEYINRLCQNNLIEYGENIRFNPDSPISVLEATQLCVNILGYGEYAKSLGKYGTFTVASDLNLLDVSDYNQELTILDLYQLTYNTLMAKTPKIVGVNVGKQTKNFDPNGKRLIEKVYGLSFVEGVLNATDYNALYGVKLREKQVMIGEDVFENSKTLFTQYIGQKVRGFYEVDKEKTNQDIAFIVAKSSQIIAEVSSDNFRDFSFNSLKFTYEGEEKQESIILSNKARVMKNNVIMPDVTKELFEISKAEPKDLRYKFIDNNKDNDADVVIIEEITDIVLQSISVQNGYKIYGKFGATMTELGEKDVVNFYLDGETAEYDDLKLDYGVSIVGGNGGYSVYGKKDFTNSKITAISAEDRKVQVDYDKYFKVSSMYSENLNELMGKRGNVYYNVFDKIIYIKAEGGFRYGYLTNMVKFGDLNSGYKMRVFTDSGSFSNLTIDAKATVDGVKTKGTQPELKAALTEGGNVVPQLIKYKINLQNVVTNIDTVKTNTVNMEDDLKKYSYKDEIFYYRDGIFMGSYQPSIIIVDTDTKIIKVPADITDEKGFSVEGITIFGPGDEVRDALDCYDGDGIISHKAVVMKAKAPAEAVYKDSGSCLVTKVSSGLTENAEETQIIYGVVNGSLQRFTVSSNSKVDTFMPYLSAGDVIRLSAVNNEIRGAYMVYDLEGKAPLSVLGPKLNGVDALYDGQPNTQSTIFSGYSLFALGNIVKVKDNYIEMSCSPAFKPILNISSVANVYIFDTKSKKVTIGSKEDLVIDEKILVRTFEGYFRDAIIYK